MSNKNERKKIWEITQMGEKISPLNGLSAGPTQTAAEVAKSWVMHEPLFKRYRTATCCLSAIMHFNEDTPESEKKYYEDEYEKAVSEFWEINRKAFQDLSNRPVY